MVKKELPRAKNLVNNDYVIVNKHCVPDYCGQITGGTVSYITCWHITARYTRLAVCLLRYLDSNKTRDKRLAFLNIKYLSVFKMTFQGNWEQVSGENRDKILEALGKFS